MTIAGAHADYRREDFFFPRAQTRPGKLIRSKPPIRWGLSRVAFFIGAVLFDILAAAMAWANRPYRKHRSF